MQLHLNNTSPFARVVRIVALEKGLADQLELCWSDPWSDDTALLEVNPIGRIPALVLDDGESIAESLLIAQYLDTLADTPALLPPAQLATALHLAGLGHGLMEAAFHTVISRRHHGGESDQSLLGQRRLRAMERTLIALEVRYTDQPAEELNLGDIVVAVALDYLAFRLPEIDWQTHCPSLAARYRYMTERSSFRETVFG